MKLVGHIVPKLSIALLIGIRVLCDAGCEVVFTKTNCNVWYKGKIILREKKDPSTDLWTLPIGPNTKKWNSTVSKSMVQDTVPNTKMWNSTVSKKIQDLWTLPIGPNTKKWNSTVSKSIVQDTVPKTQKWNSTVSQKLEPNLSGKKYKAVPADAHERAKQVASFTHFVKTRANAVKFAHQSLCNPKILTLLKAVRRGFLDGCPNLSEKLINKYLNASPAMAKGHMKRPRHGIRSTTPKPVSPTGILPIGDASHHVPHIHLSRPPVIQAPTVPNLIGDDEDDYSIANVFFLEHLQTNKVGSCTMISPGTS
jgi:hypothetical protein